MGNFFTRAKNTIKSGLSSLANTFRSASGTQSASAAMAFPLTQSGQQTITNRYGTAVGPQNQPTRIVAGGGQVPGRSTPIPTNSTQIPTNDIIHNFGGQVGGRSSPIYSAPVTIGGGTNRSGTNDLQSFSTLDSFGSVNTTSTSPASAFSFPSAPSVANPGRINNGGLGMGDFTIDPETNMVVPVQVDENKRMEELKALIPERENINDDPEIQRQRAEVNRRKQEVANYTAQLNSVVAQQNADLLRLREIGSREGVTETVYGGQAATINREAAIKALPIQAQIAAAQGNLDLAQDYLTQLTSWKKEAIDNDYTYRKNVYSLLKEHSDKQEKRAFDKLEKEDDRAYREAQKLIDEQDRWAREAIKNGQSGLVQRINNTTSRAELRNVASALVRSSGGSGGVPSVSLSADKQRVLMGGGFTSAEINQIQRDINQYGLDAVLEGIQGESKKRAVRDAYGVKGSETSNLSRQNISSLFGIPNDNSVSGFWNSLPWIGKNQTNAQKLDALMKVIEQYQAVGYSDKEILKMMQ